MVDDNTRKTLSSIPLLQTNAGPRDKELWVQRLKEEYQALIKVNVFFKYSWYKYKFTITIYFSMFKTINHQIQIGSGWNRTKKERNGSENVGTCTTY